MTSSRVNGVVALYDDVVSLDEKNRSCCEAIVDKAGRATFLEATATRASRDAALRDTRRVIVTMMMMV